MNHNNTRTELHLHTKLSDDISVISVEEMMEQARRFGVTAVAFTNLNNVQDFPTIAKAYKKCGDPNLKIIYGAELRYRNEDDKVPYGVTVLVKNQDGIKELYKIISSINNDGVCDSADLAVLEKNRKNLLVGSCGNVGELYEAVAIGKDLEKIAAFYDYFEIFPADDEKEQAIYKKIYELGEKLGVPVVASGNCHYLDKEDEICRRVIRTINGHKDDNKKLFLHTTDEMLAEVSYLGEEAACKAVVMNANLIAGLVEPVSPVRDGFYMPVIENAYEQVHELAYTKAKEIYGDNLPTAIAERLKTELHYIKNGEFASHYLIAYRMVKHMNDLGYYVGTRGSVGSVLVAFLLGISDINPMSAHYYCESCHFSDFEVTGADGFDLPDKPCPICGNVLKADGHNLPFEFFMGYDGSKMPDIDLKFPASKCYAELEFLQELFGAGKLAYACMIVTMGERCVDGYITEYEVETGDCFATEMRDHICEKLCGIKQYEGSYPGRVIVLPEGMKFEDFTPLRKNTSHSPIKNIIHFKFYSLHDTIMELDVLGHQGPDIFKMLEDFTGRSIQDVSWNNPEIYVLFAHADTLGIPEFDTDFMKDMLLKTEPGCFADLVQISGLSHGSNTWFDNGEELLNNGHALHELPALRDGVFLQLIQYGVERKDAFKIAEYVRRGRFCYESETTVELKRLMKNVGVPEWYLQSLRKIRYMFPKAHAAAYVMNSVRMAWFKIYYPTEFYAAYLSCCFNSDAPMSEEDELHFREIVEECSSKGIELLEPDAEKSDSKNYIPESGNIRMPYIK